MPYVSDQQRKYFNANRDKIGDKVVDEFNEASKGIKLPKKVKKKTEKSLMFFFKKAICKLPIMKSNGNK
jgi:hypothetical protein